MKFVSKSIFIGISVLSLSCGQPEDINSDVKILWGEVVDDSQGDARRHSTVALTTNISRTGSGESLMDQKRSFCTGTVISEDVIITAAHCLQSFDPSTRKKGDLILPKQENFIVSFDTVVDAAGRFIAAKKVIPHPDWDPASTLNPMAEEVPNDIGMIILEKPVPDHMRVVEIADPNLDIKGKEKVFLAGYGVTSRRSKPDTGTLRQVAVNFKTSDQKKKKFSVGKFLQGACAGDSGGPAYVKVGNEMQLIGATSTGIELFGYCIGIHNNYTDVRQYKDWIARTISANR